MKKTLSAILALLCASATQAEFCAQSPDGRNEIAVSLSPLRYEVRRDGKVLVAPTLIGLVVDGRRLSEGAVKPKGVVRTTATVKEFVPSPVYKKSRVDVARSETFLDFDEWGVRLVARDDGVAYRFESKKTGTHSRGWRDGGRDGAGRRGVVLAQFHV